MVNRLFFLALVMALVAVCPVSSPAIAPEVEKDLSMVKILIINEETKEEMWKLAAGETDFKVVDLKLGPRDFETELGNALETWIIAGGGALLYHSYPSEEASSRVLFPELPYDETGNWNRIKAKAFSEHEILEGVRTLELWSRAHIPVESESLFTSAHGWEILAQWEYSEDVRIYAIAGLLGAGRVVVIASSPYFPEYHGSFFDNERFLVNVIQWLAGNQVPMEVMESGGSSDN